MKKGVALKMEQMTKLNGKSPSGQCFEHILFALCIIQQSHCQKQKAGYGGKVVYFRHTATKQSTKTQMYLILECAHMKIAISDHIFDTKSLSYLSISFKLPLINRKIINRMKTKYQRGCGGARIYLFLQDSR